MSNALSWRINAIHQMRERERRTGSEWEWKYNCNDSIMSLHCSQWTIICLNGDSRCLWSSLFPLLPSPCVNRSSVKCDASALFLSTFLLSYSLMHKSPHHTWTCLHSTVRSCISSFASPTIDSTNTIDIATLLMALFCALLFFLSLLSPSLST